MSDFTVEECKRWLASPFTNPRTGERLDNLGRTGIFGILQKRSQVLGLIKGSTTTPHTSAPTPTATVASNLPKLPKLPNIPKKILLPVVKPPTLASSLPQVTAVTRSPKKAILPKILPRPIMKPSTPASTNLDTSVSSARETSANSVTTSVKPEKPKIIISKKPELESKKDETPDSLLAAKNYIKILESEAYIEEFHHDIDSDTADPTDDSDENDLKPKLTDDSNPTGHGAGAAKTGEEMPRKRGRPPKAKAVNTNKAETLEKDENNGLEGTKMDGQIRPRIIRKNKRVRYYMYTGWCEDSNNPDNDGVIPIVNSNWVELIETLGKEIYLLESLNKHRISIIEVISDRIDFKDFVRKSEILRAEQAVKNTDVPSEYDYLEPNYQIPCLTTFMGNKTYDTQESRMLLEFLTTLEDVMIDLGHIVLDVEKKSKVLKKLPKRKILETKKEAERETENDIDLTRPDIDPGTITIDQMIRRVDLLLKPLLKERQDWEDKYAEYFTDDDWFYIDFYKMVEDLSITEFKELAQRTYKRRVPDIWLTEQYRDTEDIEEFLAHLEVTIDELYGSEIAQEGSDDYEARLTNIITEFTRIKKS